MSAKDKKLVRIVLCAAAVLLLLQAGFYAYIALFNREILPGPYVKMRFGDIQEIPEDTPYLDLKINIDGYSLGQSVRYFNEIALRDEGHDYVDIVRKWTEPIRFYAKGTPDDVTWEVLRKTFAEMNKVEGFPGIVEVDREEDATLIGHFYDDEVFNTYVRQFSGNKFTNGCSHLEMNEEDGSIKSGIIAVRNSIDEPRRRSVICEELVQAMGLQNDSYSYPDSLFYQGPNEVPEPNGLDWIVFRLLYHPLIRNGMNYVQCVPVLVHIIEH